MAIQSLDGMYRDTNGFHKLLPILYGVNFNLVSLKNIFYLHPAIMFPLDI